MSRRVMLTTAALLALVSSIPAQSTNPLFANSYAVVIGIDNYAHSKWPKLNYAVNDARGFAQFLASQGFTVFDLYEKQATKAAIVSAVEDKLIPRLTERDRVVFFFAGHGETRPIGSGERGYLVPADGTNEYGSLIPLAQIHDLSDLLQVARHQLFILDSCFGGLAATRSSNSTIDPTTPNYVYEITRRRARQLLTAGGANERVRDGGPDGHSFFTGQLLRALNDGIADKNGDGYITFSELSGYIQSAASTYNQTPGTDFLKGHELGDFLFVNRARPNPAPNTAGAGPAETATRGAAVDVYAILDTAIKQFETKNYQSARESARKAADLGNAEAMMILAKMDWEGWGAPVDRAAAMRQWQAAGERGHPLAMQTLIQMYSQPGLYRNEAEAIRWKSRASAADRFARGVAVVGADGQRTSGEPSLPASALAPSAPTNLRIVN